jgi:hypothetical protein
VKEAVVITDSSASVECGIGPIRMGQRITKRVPAHEVEAVSHGELLHVAIATAVHERLRVTVKTAP